MIKPFHRRITRSVLAQQGFSKSVAEFVAEASTWPDYYRWLEPAAHAQTPSSAKTEDETNRARERAVALFRSYQQKFSTPPLRQTSSGSALPSTGCRTLPRIGGVPTRNTRSKSFCFGKILTTYRQATVRRRSSRVALFYTCNSHPPQTSGTVLSLWSNLFGSLNNK